MSFWSPVRYYWGGGRGGGVEKQYYHDTIRGVRNKLKPGTVGKAENIVRRSINPNLVLFVFPEMCFCEDMKFKQKFERSVALKRECMIPTVRGH